jgi:hypothetical protein
MGLSSHPDYRYHVNDPDVANQLQGGVAVGQSSPTTITNIRVYSQTITPSAVGAATVSTQTFVNNAAISNATGIVGVRVSAANTLEIKFVNPTAGSLTPTAGTWTIIAIRS